MGNKRTVLFIVNGLGMGNSTRCHAVIQELHKLGCEIHVITSGNGANYMKNVSEVRKVNDVSQLQYGSQDGAISILQTIRTLPQYIRIFQKNASLIEQVVSKLKPDAVVLDSTYVTKPMKTRNIPIIAINNSDFVVRNFFRFKRFPPVSTLPQFFLVEFLDYLFHRLKVDIVLSPSLVSAPAKRMGKFWRIGSLVRRGYGPQPPPQRPHNAVVMLSGSAFGSQVHQDFDSCGLRINVIGRDKPQRWPEKRTDVVFHGKLMDNKEIVTRADFAVVNCGYSAISECIHLQKPLVVAPISNHAEQWVNARAVQDLKFGVLVKETAVEWGMRHVIEEYEKFTSAYGDINSNHSWSNGRQQAAEIIMETASRGHS